MLSRAGRPRQKETDRLANRLCGFDFDLDAQIVQTLEESRRHA
jgi:hypothetical protein